jgi:hypothetical protein
MASPYPTSAQEIYDWLEADAELGDLLGSYRLADGSQMPALAVLWPTESMPPGVEPFGVEVVIRRQVGSSTVLWSTGEQQLNPTWRLTVTQWEPMELGDWQYEAVLQRLVALLPGASWSDVTLPGTTVGLAQAVLRWGNPAVVIPAEV